MTSFLKPLAFMAGALFAVASAPAAEQAQTPQKELFLNPVIAYAAPPAADAAWNENCGFGAEIKQYLVDYATAYKVAEKEATDFAGLKLNLAATSSPESGRATRKQPKWVRLTGQLVDKDNSVVGNFDFHQELTWASLQDCKALKYMAYNFGGSLVSWLGSPRPLTRVEPTIEAKPEAMDEETRQQCKGDTSLPLYLMHNGEGYVATTQETPPGKSLRLQMKVEDSRVIGGRWFTGGKWVIISGRLLDGDQLVGSFRGETSTTGYYGLCDTLDYLMQRMGGYIVEWLRAPTLDAQLPLQE